jgi:hypothetical protein
VSGTSANLNVTWQTAAIFGFIHLLLYVGFILLVPIFLITAGLIAAWNQWMGQSGMGIARPSQEDARAAGEKTGVSQ